MEQLQRQVAELAQRVQYLSAENDQLKQQSQQQVAFLNAALGTQQQMVDALSNLNETIKKERDTTGRKVLVDSKGLGKPKVFDNNLDKFRPWSRGVENYVVGVVGPDFRNLMEWSAEAETPITKSDIESGFGAGADDLDRIEDVHHKCSQWFLALEALTEEESQDIVVGAGPENGPEAWRKLVKRWDPVVAGRNRTLLKTIIAPEPCKLEELTGVWEKWEASIRKYERRKDSSGDTLKISNDLKMAAFEQLLPPDLENHLVLNKKRLCTYDLQKEEIEGILDSRIGAKVRELQIKPSSNRKAAGDPMDVDAFNSKGTKGKDKGKGKFGKYDKSSASYPSSSVVCWECGKNGHKAADCWSKRAQGQGAGKGKSHDKGKGKGDGSKAKGGPGWKAPTGKGKGKKGISGFEVPQASEDADWSGNCGQDAWWPEQSQGDAPGTSSNAGTQVLSLDLCSFAEGPAAPSSKKWLKLNYDTGAAITVFPQRWAPEAVGDGATQYRTASNELVGDQGGYRVTGQAENGCANRVTGRLANVHKVLVSASRCATHGRNGWVTQDGGYLIPDDSPLSHKIKKMIHKEASKQQTSLIPMYLENGVYNFYLEVEDSGSSREHTDQHGCWVRSETSPFSAGSLDQQPHQQPQQEPQQQLQQQQPQPQQHWSGFPRQPCA